MKKRMTISFVGRTGDLAHQKRNDNFSANADLLSCGDLVRLNVRPFAVGGTVAVVSPTAKRGAASGKENHSTAVLIIESPASPMA
jgi:hypothetical protein